MARRVDLAVIGAGITGLAAAWEAHRQGADVVVLESSDVPGGKLRTSSVAGLDVDESADAFLARVPDAVGLCSELGIDAELTAPRTGRAYVWARSALRLLPEQQLLGVPTDLDAVARSGILTPAGIARARQDLTLGNNREHGDEPVAALVRRRLGDEVNDTLVAPLIGGIWAGDCDRLSIQVAAPALADAAQRGSSLIRGAQVVRAVANAEAGTPVFLAPRGGMARLVDRLVDELDGGVWLGHTVGALTPDGPNGSPWRIEPAGLSATSVVIATPATVTAELLSPHAPGAARVLAEIEHASVVLVTLAVARDAIEHPLDGSGFLVPKRAGLLLTACSWASSKWEHLAGDGSTVILRASAGRDGDGRAMRLSDRELLRALHDDLRLTMGLHADASEIGDVRIGRWHDAFPQPRPLHLERIATVAEELASRAPNVALAGAWAQGVGIPACIRAGRQAARNVLGARSSPLR